MAAAAASRPSTSVPARSPPAPRICVPAGSAFRPLPSESHCPLRRQLQPQHTLPAHRQQALLLEPAVDGAGLPCRARALADGAGVAADGIDAVRARGVREGRVPTAHVPHHSPTGGHARVDVVRHARARQILAALAVFGVFGGALLAIVWLFCCAPVSTRCDAADAVGQVTFVYVRQR